MKNIAGVFWGMLVLVLVGSCRVGGPVNTCNNQPATLVFGQGGGVTGKYTEFALVSDGTLYSCEPKTGQRTKVKKIARRELRRFFSDAESLGLLSLQFNNPHNMNHYLIFSKGTRSNKVNWGDAKNPPPAAVKDLWERLWALRGQTETSNEKSSH